MTGRAASARGFPPPPNGWFAVAWSDELAPGDARPLRAFGRGLVAARAASGWAEVRGARAGAWRTAEANGLVHVYHHAEGAPPPSPPAITGPLGVPGWTALPRWGYEMHSHPQEIAENVADLGHFGAVHRVSVGAPELCVDGETFRVCVEARPRLGGRELPLPTRIEMTCHGLGHVVVNLRLGALANVRVLAYATPVETDRVRVRHRYFAEVGSGARAAARWPLAQAIRRAAIAQVSEDRTIWEHKIYQSAPRLCAEDRLIGPFRRWARQFYGLDA